MAPPTASVLILLLLSSFHLLSAAPSSFPKSAWIRKENQRRASHSPAKRYVNATITSSASGCAVQPPTIIVAPKQNIWAGLTNDEAAAVTAWLFAQPDLNLTTTENATEWDNTLLLVELMEPNKTDALNFLDQNGPTPPRWAHVLLDNRATINPYYQDILVGPLPVQNGSTTWQPLTYPYTRKTEGKIRNLEADDDTLYTDWLYLISASILDITLDLWGGSALGLDNDTIDIWGIDPLWQHDDGSIIRWDTFWNFPTTGYDTKTLLPLGLYFMSNVTGRDPSKWSLGAAYYSPGFVKLPPNVDGPWGDTYQQGPVLPLDTLYPPTEVAPAGSRYFVDADQKYIKWMDFEFYLGFTRDTGMHLHDIRYKGERIIYEIGLQEALAHYAGNDPVSSGTSYLDSYYGFGPYSFELVKGYDCPPTATYLNSSFYTAETTHTHIDSICLFETDADHPMQRHSQSYYVSVTKNVFFTVRNVCTVGNYDYMFSYQFYLDGTIHVEVRASGYIQAAYFANNGEYGYHIHDALSGSMHDHVLNFKLDMDILGTANTMLTTTPVSVSQVYPWSNGQARNTMKLEKGMITSEDESKLFWGPNGATQFTIVNLDDANQYGEYRGYRILPSEGTIHLTVQNSSNLVNAANWANYDFAVTQQHDTEPRSAYPYNTQDVNNPVINFDDFFNGENLVQTDLVVWFNLGMHHLPHTGDLPNTVFTTAHSGLQIMPLNYLLGDPSRQTVNMVEIDYLNGNVSQVQTFGQQDTACELDFTPVEPSLYDYKGDVVIRKFPYDPNDPYYETDAIV